MFAKELHRVVTIDDPDLATVAAAIRSVLHGRIALYGSEGRCMTVVRDGDSAICTIRRGNCGVSCLIGADRSSDDVVFLLTGTERTETRRKYLVDVEAAIVAVERFADSEEAHPSSVWEYHAW